MHNAPLSLTFSDAQILTPDGLMAGDLSISEGFIGRSCGRRINADGYLILPGIIDLHGDGFEHHMAPRRGAQSEPTQGLRAVEAELAANGITTAMLAQFFSWEGGMRGPDSAETLIRAVADHDAGTDLHIQLRLEVAVSDLFDRASALIDAARIRYVVLNDHLPHRALAAGKRPPRLTGQALKSGRSPEAHLAMLQDLHKSMPRAIAALAELTSDLTAKGVRLGSHDDRTSEDRARFRALGADICEFPETLKAAETARAAGEPIIMGAPNVVRGGSHDKKIAAADLIAKDWVDALVSDYHYPSLHRAALKLWQDGLPLQQAWGLVSSGPARVMGWDDRGHLSPGLRADLVLMHAQTRRIEGVLCHGRVTHLSGELAARMVG
ncbi:alpha-D-ribose 1-methylphosphonate 5-triphosphate diphosphatase [Gymnodinialimonas ceratoperidinii]|uniref:Alpha-D-ribose 1-methylphosphonate 5-triphosphate diphosphatase n=1 Tax=Gymnodinialimonas ceratoperidinii TaxID=2856823 RepID=A0A8F6YDR3_9RHOB|nr:alpha-D-ribose 1-methylphosphonate 5-triphosphate diphosphatase [Gymnodinialimonas ceratoperidinii]QXT40765.1 alpha-D-ribose 1-methylphosphonate 5-triphosphate diphosphatase [Gymnodinialimonas ceratoperidinii]